MDRMDSRRYICRSSVTIDMPGPKTVKAPGPPREPPGGPPPGETSFELVQRACTGDSEAENEICRRYTPRLHRWARGRLPPGARPALQTADVVQEVLIKAIRSFPEFEVRHEHSFPAYLRTILANKLLDIARAQMRRPAPKPLDDAGDAPSREASPFDHAASAERQARFDAALKTLRPRDQELIFLRLELGLDYDEMVETLGGDSNANAVRISVRRAMIRLGGAVAKLDGPDRA